MDRANAEIAAVATAILNGKTVNGETLRGKSALSKLTAGDVGIADDMSDAQKQARLAEFAKSGATAFWHRGLGTALVGGNDKKTCYTEQELIAGPVEGSKLRNNGFWDDVYLLDNGQKVVSLGPNQVPIKVVAGDNGHLETVAHVNQTAGFIVCPGDDRYDDGAANHIAAQERRAANPVAPPASVCKGANGQLDTELTGARQLWAKMTVGMEDGSPRTEMFVKGPLWTLLCLDAKRSTTLFQDALRLAFE